MFCRKNQYLKIQKYHHKALKIAFNSDNGCDELLQVNNENTIHQKHLHALICEVFKSLSLCGLISHLKMQHIILEIDHS